MKNSILFTLILAGLALSGCSGSTRSSTAPADATAGTATPTSRVAIDQSAPYSVNATAANTNANASTNSSPFNESSSAPNPASATTTPGPGTSSTYNPTDTSAPVPANRGLTGPSGISPDSNYRPSTESPASLDPGRLSNDLAAQISSGGVAGRVSEWHLSAPEIQSDLDRGATIVRTKDAPAGSGVAKMGDDLLQMMVQGKLQADSETSKAKLDVEAKNGEVMLKGTADSAAAIGRAIALALDTKDVTKVTADAKISSPTKD